MVPRLLRSVCACVLVQLVLCAMSAQAQTVRVQSHESRFWIEGSSSVNTFQCHVDTVQGRGRLVGVQSASVPARGDSSAAHSQAQLTIPVRTFDCGNARMTEDLRETLQAEDHPTIRFELDRVHLKSRPDSANGWYRLEALGYLTIAGTERLVRVMASGRKVTENRFELQGSTSLKMSYFGIEPPTKLMGLVRVHDQIEVHFDLVARSTSSQSSLPVTRSAQVPSPVSQ